MSDQIYIATGQVIDRDSGRGMKDLLVEAWDSDPQHSQLLGNDKTDENGRFSISFDLKKFNYKTAPDLFFKVHRDQKLLESTEASVLWNANTQENVTIKIRMGRERAPGRDRITSDQVFKGVDFFQKSDFKGVFKEYRSKAATTGGHITNILKKTLTTMDLNPVRVRGASHRDIVDQDVEAARNNLKSKNIEVNEVLPYKPDLRSESMGKISLLPRNLKAGQKLNLYEENGKVRYYSIVRTTPVSSSEELDKHLEKQTSELNKLREELKITQENTAKKDEQISSLQKDAAQKDEKLSSLQKDAAQKDEQLNSLRKDAAKKDEQLNSLQKDLESLRKSHSEIHTLIKSENFSKLMKGIAKPEKKPKGPNK